MLRTARLVSLALLVLAPAVRAQGPAAGMLLVARPALEDPNFAESVLLLIYHDSNGSLGILLNRPTNLRPSRVFPEVEALAGYTDPVFFGGPLEPRQILVLLRDPPLGTLEGDPLIDDVYITADASVVERLEPRLGVERVRLYAGHAAWGPGQLQGEIDAGDWSLLPGNVDLVFANKPLELWRATATRQDALIAGRDEPN
ncbi:MAG TPA: YqgE/AlgH family protein [Gammaproteobacteria bacterium]|jgi:putative transcriptional regulator